MLCKRDNWPTIAFDIVQHISDRAIVIAADERPNLGGKAFEYLFKPVLQAKMCCSITTTCTVLS